MAKIGEYIFAVRALTKESGGSSLYDSGENDYESFVRSALRKYSLDRPDTKVSSITGTSTQYITVDSSNFPSYIDHWSAIERIEALSPDVTKNEEPTYIERDEWDYYRNSTTLYVFLYNHKPTADDTTLVTYTIPHTIEDLDSATADTVPAVDFEAVVLWGASRACLALASKFSGTNEPSLRADVVNYGSKSGDYRAMSKEFSDRYMSWIAEPVKAASIVRDLDFGYGFADNQSFQTHRSYSRN